VSAGVGDTEDKPEGVAQVRDGRPGIEVLVVRRDIDGVIRTLPWLSGSANRAIPTVDEPDWYLAKVVATCTLGLPAALCHPGIADAVIAGLERNYFPGWQDAYLLKGQLVLVLDHQNRATLAGFDLHYTPELGLEHERAKP
jgi:CRISPR-associated endonuclease/helicase Cas3